MKRFILTQFAIGILIIGLMARIWLLLYGYKGMVGYLIFAGLCMVPAVVKARKIMKEEKGGDV